MAKNKSKKGNKGDKSNKKSKNQTPKIERNWEELGLMMGLEIHQQLNTKHKLFCPCSTELTDDEFDDGIQYVSMMPAKRKSKIVEEVTLQTTAAPGVPCRCRGLERP